VVTEPQVLSTRREADQLHMQLRIPRDLDVLAGHFPGLPIVPGVVLMKWAIDFGRREFALTGTFQRLAGVKFMRIMPLDADVNLTLSRAGDELSFEYDDAGKSCVQGRVRFGPA
jgi:3-hydroxymyristoyl/3-hydroxydecanoyl-(acyl carrier protein) dehydratase